MNPGSEEVKIDVAHADLLHGLVRAAKPTRVLELGFGGGRACVQILRGLALNRQAAQYVLVDNWTDWDGMRPAILDVAMEDSAMLAPEVKTTVITADEGEFVRNYLAPRSADPDSAKGYEASSRLDFIMSDADHHHSHEWFNEVYMRMLAPGGTMVVHDVDGTYPGLANLPKVLATWGVPHKVFDRSSRPDERCGRGLLVIFKPEEPK